MTGRANKGRTGQPHSPETRAKISAAMMGNTNRCAKPISGDLRDYLAAFDRAIAERTPEAWRNCHAKAPKGSGSKRGSYQTGRAMMPRSVMELLERQTN